MKDVVERNAMMGEEQNGFRRDRRGEDNLYVMIEMIERMKKENMKGYFACLDIDKAYVRVDRKVLCAVLKHIGIDMKVVNIISSMHEDTKAISRTNEYIYLGCVLNMNGCEKAKNEKLLRAQQ